MPAEVGVQSATVRAGGLDAVFRPRSIAVLGASAKPEKHGYRLVDNLTSVGRDVSVYPISRTPGSILGHVSYRSLRELPEPPDLVLVSIPAAGVPEAIEDAAAVSAGSAVIFAGGFAEAGARGRELQERTLRVARDGAVRLVGPNCMGICNLHEGLHATYFRGLPTEPGQVGVVSQSGGFGGVAFAELYRLGVGVSKFASIGNMADISHAELIRYLGRDERTRAIAAFVESAPNGTELLDAVAEVSAVKPVVILKGARTQTGERAAASHTGALASEGRVWEALLREAGAIVAEDSDDLFDAAATLVRCERRLPQGRRVAIVTVSGGPSVIAADACERYDLELPDLEDALDHIRPIVPDIGSLRNPVDFTSQMGRDDYGPAVTAVAALPDVDAVLAVNVGLDVPQFAEAFAAAREASGKPAVGYAVGDRLESVLAHHGIPNLPSVERAVRAVRRLWEQARVVQRAAVERRPVRFHFDATPGGPDGDLDEHVAKRLLGEHGVPVTRERVVGDVVSAIRAAGAIGYPVALKVVSGAILHKTEAGAVTLDLRDASEVQRAYAGLVERLPGRSVLVQEMVAADAELIAGARRDPQAGPIVVLGLGGILVELHDDVTFARAPLAPDRALEMVDELRGRRLLDGFRGALPLDRALLAELLERLAALLVANPQIGEIELNPVIVHEGRLTVADALVRHRAGFG